MVAEAFASIEDPLVIVSSGIETPRVHAPCAIFVDLRRPREELMSVLFPSKTTPSGQKDKAATTENHIEEIGDEHSNGDHSRVETEVGTQSNNNNTQDSGSNTGMKKSRRKKSKKNSGSNTQNASATVLLDVQPCARKHTILPEANNSWDELTTLKEANNSWDESIALPEEANNSWDEFTTLHEGNNSWDDLKQPSFASSDMSHREVESVSSSGNRTTVQTTVEWLQSSKQVVDRFERKSVMGREWKVVEKVGSESSHTTEVLSEKQYVEETDDEHSNGGLSLSEFVLEKQSSNESTQDVGIKKKKGRNKGRWMKKNKGSNSLNTFTGEKHSNDLSSVNLVLEKQASNENTKGVEIKKGNGKNMEKWIRKNQGSNSLNTVTSDEHSKDHPRVELKLEKQVSNENTKDVEIKKGKGKNVDIWLKKSKCSNSVNTFTSDEHTYNDHSLEKFVVVKQSSNENTQHAEIKKGKGKSKSNTDGKSLNTFTTVLVDGQHFIKESTTSHRVNNACKDLKQSSSASDRSQPEADLPVSKSDEMTTGKTFVERLQNRPVVDGFLSYVGSESSNISEALRVEEIVDDHNIREYSSQKLVLEKQNSDDNTKDLENKNRKGNYVAGEDTTMHEANSACNDMNASSSAFDTRITTADAVKCGSFLGLAVAFLGISMWKKT